MRWAIWYAMISTFGCFIAALFFTSFNITGYWFPLYTGAFIGAVSAVLTNVITRK